MYINFDRKVVDSGGCSNTLGGLDSFVALIENAADGQLAVILISGSDEFAETITRLGKPIRLEFSLKFLSKEFTRYELKDHSKKEVFYNGR